MWKVLVALFCPSLCDPIDCSPAGSFVHGILQARILEWTAISFSRGSSRPGIEPRSPALHAASFLSESPGKPQSCGAQTQLLRGMWDLPGPGIELVSPALGGRFFTTQPPGKPLRKILTCVFKPINPVSQICIRQST